MNNDDPNPEINANTNTSTNNNTQPTNLRILQANLCKSQHAHLALINDALKDECDILLIQEPHLNYYDNVSTPTGFRQVYPERELRKQKGVRSAIWVNAAISTDTWRAITIPNSVDITAIQLDTDKGALTILNIYNDCNNDDTLTALDNYLEQHQNDIYGPNKLVLWCGDFNRHHPLWDSDADGARLFTSKAIEDAERLIDLQAKWNMTQLLPKGHPTLQHWVTGSFSRPDNVFGSVGVEDTIVKCEVLPHLRPPKTDHYPVGTILDVSKAPSKLENKRNFRNADWAAFKKDLGKRLTESTTNWTATIDNEDQFNKTVEELTDHLQQAINATIPISRPIPSSKRWWTAELTQMKKKGRKLSRISYKNRALPHHEAHEQWKEHQTMFAKMITETKKQHWEDFLEEASEREMWSANKYIKEPVGDGGQPRIPSLKEKLDTGATRTITSNDEKANILAKSFFPPKPEHSSVPPDQHYPDPLPPAPPLHEERLKRHIRSLSPHKAPGPDGIPNVVLQETADIITPILTKIFNAAIKYGWYHRSWKESITCVIKKPGKPDYQQPKAYRPIALLSTTAKLLSAIIAEDMSYLIETHQLLPNNHFGGRPGRTTTDALHYLTAKINKAWNKGKVVSILFLDVEGAFPNAVTERVIHNMRKRRIPEQYVRLIENMLKEQKTKLKFDDFISELIAINNGIGQGCPLSMIIYILYNADLIDIPNSAAKEDALGYVDDAALIAIGDSFEETVATLQDMMEREDGAFNWSETHNSKFEITKVAVMHCSRKTRTDPETGNKTKQAKMAPDLIVRGETIKRVETYKYLGVMLDSELRWKAQTQRATEKATKWILMFKQLTRPSTGVKLSLMRQLYLSVGIPKLTYALDVWYSPPHKNEGRKHNSGSVAALKRMTRIQALACITISGAMKNTAGDIAEVHANIPCMKVQLRHICHRAIIRMATLPASHPNYPLIRQPPPIHPTSNETQVTKLLRMFDIHPTTIEKIKPFTRPPAAKLNIASRIADKREDTIEYEKSSEADIKIYTDGSGYEGGVGAAAVMYRKGSDAPAKTLQYHLGSDKLYSTYDAEGVGLILAAHIIKQLEAPQQEERKIEIFTDCQSAITTATSDSQGPGQHIMAAFQAIIDNLPPANFQQTNLTIIWISAHSDVQGNEKADEEAKKAAQRKTTPTIWLPKFLHKKLKTSASKLRQHAKKQRTDEWKKWWTERDPKTKSRREALDKIDAEFPFTTYFKTTKHLDRNSSSLLTQLRSGIIPLRAELHRMRLEESPYCQACNLQLRETIEHVIRTCPAYNQQRKTLKKAIYNRGLINPRKYLNDPVKSLAIMKFFKSTGRWKSNKR